MDRLGALDGAPGWLNSPPLTVAGLRGRVVLVEFWTYTCINWLRTMPYVREWAARYEGDGIELAADWDTLRSPENYLGHERSENFASAAGAGLDRPYDYRVPDRLRLNSWGLSGRWTVGRDRIVAGEAGAAIAYRFEARDLHLVMGSGRFRVLVDGAPAPGLDVDAGGCGTATGQRLHQLVRQSGPVRERTCEITFLDAGVEAFVFTFG